MRTSAAGPFNEFLQLITPLVEVRQTYSGDALALLETLDFACLAMKRGSGWAAISSKAVLRTSRREPERQLTRIALLPEIAAFKGHMPAGAVTTLLADLSKSWVLDYENTRVSTRARDYDWKSPYLIKSTGKYWPREVALHGNGPDLSSLLASSTLQKIDRELRVSSPAFDGFDGLCARLGLPIRRNNLTSSFQVSAELPAEIYGAHFRLDPLGFEFEMLDVQVPPDITVEWLPGHELQTISKDQISWADDPAVPRSVLIRVLENSPEYYEDFGPPGGHKAKVTLWFGELRADVVTVDLDLGPVYSDAPDYQDLRFEREEPPAPDLAGGKEPSRKRINRKRAADPDSDLGRRRAIAQYNPKLSAKAMCVLHENSEIAVPDGKEWQDYRPYHWPMAYKKNKKLRGYIGTLVSKDKHPEA